MFSIPALVQLVTVVAAIAAPSFGALIKRDDCSPLLFHIYLGADPLTGDTQYLSTAHDYLGNLVFEPVEKSGAETFEWSPCDPLDFLVYVGVMCLIKDVTDD